MKKLITAALFALSTTTQAGHFTTSYSKVTYSESGLSDLDLGALSVSVGGGNEYGGLEIRGAYGVKDGQQHFYFGGQSFTVVTSLDYMVGVYGRLRLPNDQIEPYLIVGGTRAQLEVCASGFCDSASESDFSYGAGFDIKLGGGAMTLEYMRYFDKTEYSANALSFGVTGYF